MTIEQLMRRQARATRTRLWRPINSIPDRGFDLGGKAVAAAQAEITQRNIVEHIQFVKQNRIDARINKARSKQ